VERLRSGTRNGSAAVVSARLCPVGKDLCDTDLDHCVAAVGYSTEKGVDNWIVWAGD